MSIFRSPASEGNSAGVSPKCVSCGKEILPLPKAKADQNVVSLGGVVGVIDSGVLYQGMICETSRHIFCTGCWVAKITVGERMDECSMCGGHLIPLTSKNIPG